MRSTFSSPSLEAELSIHPGAPALITGRSAVAGPSWVYVVDDIVTATGIGPPPAVPPDVRHVDVGDAFVTAGFTDLHCHGGDGATFDGGDDRVVARAVDFHRTHGTRNTLMSLVSAPVNVLAARLRELREVGDRHGVCGVHLEGPFLAPSKRGAHDPAALRAPTPDAIAELIEAGAGTIGQVTLAPELEGAMEAIDAFVDAGVVVAVGHTTADYATAAEAFDRGARLLTHAFNAMLPLHHRQPGPVGAALDRDDVVLEVIADGHHVHDSVIRMLFASAPDRVALVSDSMAAAGCSDGSYMLGSLEVDVVSGTPYLAGTTTLAGSTLTLDVAVRRAISSGVAPADAIRAATTTPARTIGRDDAAVPLGTPLADLTVVAADGTLV